MKGRRVVELTKEGKFQSLVCRHIKGDIIDLWIRDTKRYAVIPTNCEVDKNGNAIMGAGLAKEFAIEVPELKKWLGRRLRMFFPNYSLQVFPTKRLIALPTKYGWNGPASLELISRGLAELDNLIQHDLKHYGGRIPHVFLPRIGCGLGGLDWVKEVEPLAHRYLGNSSYFTIVSLPEDYDKLYEHRSDNGDDTARRDSKSPHRSF